MTTDAWLLKLMGACDRALERLPPDDPNVAVLRADISDLRSMLHARLGRTPRHVALGFFESWHVLVGELPVQRGKTRPAECLSGPGEHHKIAVKP
jgi:hypothetical protein